MVDGRCCRGHTRSRFLRAAGSGGILGEVESLRPTEVTVTMGSIIKVRGRWKYGARRFSALLAVPIPR